MHQDLVLILGGLSYNHFLSRFLGPTSCNLGHCLWVANSGKTRGQALKWEEIVTSLTMTIVLRNVLSYVPWPAFLPYYHRIQHPGSVLVKEKRWLGVGLPIMRLEAEEHLGPYTDPKRCFCPKACKRKCFGCMCTNVEYVWTANLKEPQLL